MKKKKLPNPKVPAGYSPQTSNETSNDNENISPATQAKNEISEESDYDPKKCVKHNLEDFIPQKLLSCPPCNESKHSVDFYKEYRTFLIIYESSSSSYPFKMMETYSDFSYWVENLKFDKTLHENLDADLLVISYQDTKSKEKYVIKKCWYPFDETRKNQDEITKVNNFIRKKFNEYSIMKILNGSPNSVPPIDFHIIHLPKTKYIVTELLMPFGGTPLTENFKKLTSEELLEILKQITNSLDYLDSFNIDHNDIKDGNILLDSILGKRIIRLIDLDIGRNIPITNKSTQRDKVTGFTAAYCSPEIIQIVKNTAGKPSTFSSRKSQIYSLGVIILFPQKFIPDEMDEMEFDEYKINESSYQKFLSIFSKATKKCIADPLKEKLMKIAEICLSFNPDKRPSAKELKEIFQGFENKDINSISNQYDSILNSRSTNNSCSKTLALTGDDNINSKMKEGFNNKMKQEEEKYIHKLIAENSHLSNEIKIKQEEIEKIQYEEANLRAQLINSGKEIDKLQNDIVETSINFEKCISLLKIEHQKSLENSIKENKALNEKIQFHEKQIENLKEKNMNHENIIKEYLDRIKKLEMYQKTYEENIFEFGILKMKFEQNKMIDFFNCKSYPELANKLYESIITLKQEAKKSSKIKYIDGLQFSEDSIYNGPVNQDNQPQGPGKLNFKNPTRRFIGEFEKGKIKNNLGFIINENDSYFFGKMHCGICENTSFIFPEFIETDGKKYYFGETKQNQYNGKGKVVSLDGEYYEGEWKNGIEEGKGKKVYTDGTYYKGSWKNGKYEGKGKLVYVDKSYYDGKWKEGIKEGYGEYVSFFNDENYKGQWKNNLREGKGKAIFQDGSCYDGEFKNGKKDGKGKFVLSNNEYYEGEYKNDKNEGIGKYVNQIGEYYEGQWNHNIREGKGKYAYPNGDYYVGDWKNGTKEGKGKFVYFNQNYYEGEWKNNKEEGKGKKVCSDGGYYEGEFKNGQMEGIGKLATPNCGYYEGEYKNGIAEGRGKWVFPDGSSYNGEWKNSKAEGKGKMVCSDGSYYEGEWKNSQREGKGKFTKVILGKIIDIQEEFWMNGEKMSDFFVKFQY